MIVPLSSTFTRTYGFDMSFPPAIAINDHRRCSTGQKPAKPYPCDKCSSEFKRKGGLTYHQKYECGQPPRFKCAYCTYVARHISNARRHVRKCHPGQNMQITDLHFVQSDAVSATAAQSLRPRVVRQDCLSSRRTTIREDQREQLAAPCGTLETSYEDDLSSKIDVASGKNVIHTGHLGLSSPLPLVSRIPSVRSKK